MEIEKKEKKNKENLLLQKHSIKNQMKKLLVLIQILLSPWVLKKLNDDTSDSYLKFRGMSLKQCPMFIIWGHFNSNLKLILIQKINLEEEVFNQMLLDTKMVTQSIRLVTHWFFDTKSSNLSLKEHLEWFTHVTIIKKNWMLPLKYSKMMQRDDRNFQVLR